MKDSKPQRTDCEAIETSHFQSFNSAGTWGHNSTKPLTTTFTQAANTQCDLWMVFSAHEQAEVPCAIQKLKGGRMPAASKAVQGQDVADPSQETQAHAHVLMQDTADAAEQTSVLMRPHSSVGVSLAHTLLVNRGTRPPLLRRRRLLRRETSSSEQKSAKQEAELRRQFKK
ncbi:hypothetical protein EYF80_023323 [Liparis tanakae]|uniref:Uncharacterized protein n=1 Tax=Liparis tanakae TaxID=230148 RepID=A0A4Z2HKV1_9TELE|nr:hypothetical protein EYF80_023323 [Liparis tanakae]